MSAQLHILACHWSAPWSAEAMDAALALLPSTLHGEILRFAAPEDRQARILARLLLREGLARRGMDAALAGWRRDAWGRPFLEARPHFPAPPDFSCAHAPGLVATALGWGCRVGVDVEPCASAPGAARCSDAFSPAEWYFLEAAPPSANAFATLWTRKEALLKLDGRGLYAGPARVDALAPPVPLHAPSIHSDYVCHAATDVPCKGLLTVLPPEDWA